MEKRTTHTLYIQSYNCEVARKSVQSTENTEITYFPLNIFQWLCGIRKLTQYISLILMLVS